MRTFRCLFTVFCFVFGAKSAFAAGKASHVVVVVWDGMRPDFVGPQTTPNLYRLARSGVTFANHHPVYVSSTEVNGAALATGVYPELNGIIGNNEFRPTIDPSAKIMTASLSAVRRADRLTDNHFIECPTLAEILRAHHFGAVIAGAKTVTLLQDRNAKNEGSPDIDLFEGSVLPESFAATLSSKLSAFPAVGLPKLARDLWTTKALIGPLWQNGVPAFSMLWLSEPDFSQHATGPGSETSLEAIRSSDDNLGRVFADLERRGLREQTDIIIVSDHGFSTILQKIDVVAVLNKYGFHAARGFSPQGPKPGEVMVVGNGGAVFLYVQGRNHSLIERMVHFLQSQSFCGVIFTRRPVEGAFPLAAAKLNSPAAPDVVLSLSWTAEKSKTGVPGMVFSDYADYGAGQGMHASLSPFDMHNTCIAIGPDFRKDYHDDLPSGNVDVTPTVLAILGIHADRKFSGRVLTEALVPFSQPILKSEPHHLEATYRGRNFVWRQYLNTSEVSGVTYLLEGNGHSEPLIEDKRN